MRVVRSCVVLEATHIVSYWKELGRTACIPFLYSLKILLDMLIPSFLVAFLYPSNVSRHDDFTCSFLLAGNN